MGVKIMKTLGKKPNQWPAKQDKIDIADITKMT